VGGALHIQEEKRFPSMTITLNVFGTEFSLKQPITLDLESAPLRDVLAALQRHHEGPWQRILKDDLSLRRAVSIS